MTRKKAPMLSPEARESRTYIRIVWALALLGLALGAAETVAALWSGSRYLLRDGLEWGWDVVIYGLAALCFGRGARAERIGGYGLAAILAAIALQGAWQVWRTFVDPPELEVTAVTISAALTVAQSWFVVWLLVRFRGSRHPVIEATWLSARNDAITGSLSALVTLAARLVPSLWPQAALDALGTLLALRAAYVVARDTRALDVGEGARRPQ